ncbi:MAG TPA: hypothetical protein VGP61_09375 [Gemmatimonadales bacterium]|jgi:hypothetical protein|nr:hypothetical protein [Gemmatimonadales bacterium]
MSRRVLRFILVMLAAPFVLTSCKKEATTQPLTSVIVKLTNHGSGPITILAEGESLSSCTNCQLSAGGFRNVTIGMTRGDTFEFDAYFGGAFQQEVHCKWTGEVSISVDWDGLDLRCKVWSEA